ncbi:hypothetical protein GCWU000182_00789 [Abiotrophia defectiva ATCC 49176]|uniref:Uncharacterized protein n=1 Tax=Abiotrophia defectiva ATCC 49176 TaxID=592010 RepID=W1Q660_ABIDE|nr:hypothetical protein GCWU000182_00789 [Abiotrophia defectiva ATCC 49176]
MVHSAEWTTGSRLFRLFSHFWVLSSLASGPLDGVDHWLAAWALF